MRLIDYLSIKRALMLHPALEHAAIQLLLDCKDDDIDIRFTHTLRSIAEQDALYAQGRTTKGPIVTWAQGGDSYHNYGLALDFCLLLNGGREVSWDINKDFNCDGLSDWAQVIQKAEKLGFESGARWEKKDYPHLQMTYGLSITDCKERQIEFDTNSNIPIRLD